MNPNSDAIYKEHRDFANAGMKGFPTRDQMMDKITLPADRQWLKPKKVHPLILKVLHAPINSTFPKFRMDVGRSDEGDYFAFSGGDRHEFFRLTVRKTNPKYKTDEEGLWFMGNEELDTPPRIVWQQGILSHVYAVLKTLQVNGTDDDNDIEHMGHYVENNINGFSRTHIVFRVGTGFWILSHASRQNKHAMGYRELAVRLLECYKEDDELLHAVTRLDPYTGGAVIALYDAEDAGSYGEVIEEDVIMEFREDIEQIPSMDYINSQTPQVRQQLGALAVASQDEAVSKVVDYLSVYTVGNLIPYHLLDVPGVPHVDVRYFCMENRTLFTVRIFRKVK